MTYSEALQTAFSGETAAEFLRMGIALAVLLLLGCQVFRTVRELFFLPKDYFDLRLIFTETCLTFFKLKFLNFRSIPLLIFEAVDI